MVLFDMNRLSQTECAVGVGKVAHRPGSFSWSTLPTITELFVDLDFIRGAYAFGSCVPVPFWIHIDSGNSYLFSGKRTGVN